MIDSSPTSIRSNNSDGSSCGRFADVEPYPKLLERQGDLRHVLCFEYEPVELQVVGQQEEHATIDPEFDSDVVPRLHLPSEMRAAAFVLTGLSLPPLGQPAHAHLTRTTSTTHPISSHITRPWKFSRHDPLAVRSASPIDL